MDKILTWKRYTNSGFKLMTLIKHFPPASPLHLLPFKGFQPGLELFCHLLGAQRLQFSCFIYLLIFGLHLSLFLTVVSIKCDLPHQPTYAENANALEFHLRFLDFPTHFSVAFSASFGHLCVCACMPLGTAPSDLSLF